MSDLENEFKIRVATNRDAPEVRELVFSVLMEYGLDPDRRSTDADLEDLEGNYLRRGGSFEVVEQADGEIIGTVGLFPLTRKRVELRKMYLKASVRGKGLGKLLLQRSLEKARALQFEEVWLETNAVLQEAIQLYRRNGFQPVKSDHLAKRCDQAYLLRL